MKESFSEHLARLCFSRVILRQAVSTARQCGDFEWAEEQKESLKDLEVMISSMKERAKAEQIVEAKRITNAPI